MSINLAYFTLIGLLALTFMLSFINLGKLNDLVSLIFAILKAAVILNVFMHYRRELESSRIYFLIGLLTVLLLLTGILDDVLFR